MPDQLPMFNDLPQTDEPKKKKSMNVLSEMFRELLDGDLDENFQPIPGGRPKTELAQVQKATGIPWGTLQGWYDGDVKCQMADENLYKLCKFFDVPFEYLVYGIGSDKPMYESFKDQ